jgi:hypothetical protein
MATIKTIEQQITAEFGVVVGTLKNHAVLCTISALVIGLVIGHFL